MAMSKSNNWSDLIEDLANVEKEGLSGLQRKWSSVLGNCSPEELLKRRDELRTFIGHRADWTPVEWFLAAESVKEIADAIKGKEATHTEYSRKLSEEIRESEQWPEHFIADLWLRDPGAKWSVHWSGPRPPAIAAAGLPSTLAQLCVNNYQHLRSCDDPGCEHKPYFVAKRNDQKFCSKRCSHLGRRLTKWQWWRDNQSKAAREPVGIEAEPVETDSGANGEEKG